MSDVVQGFMYRWAGDQPPPLPAVVTELRSALWLPCGTSWWFAWHELDIILPQDLRDPAELPLDWDELHVFSPQVELRLVHCGLGWELILLTEQPTLPISQSSWQLLQESYWVTSSLRVMWGNRLRLPTGEGRGVVAFPRELRYRVVGEQQANYDQALVADVRLYHDAEMRLQTARYATMRHVFPGADDALVQPLTSVYNSVKD